MKSIRPTGRITRWLADEADRCEEDCRAKTLKLCPLRPGAILADIGCGSGLFTRRVADTVGARLTIAVDVVPENGAVVKSRGLEPVIANIDGGLPLADASVDVVMLSHVIEHVADTDGLLQECYRILKPGGHLITATPNLAALANILYLVMDKQPAIAEVSDVALVGTWSARGQDVSRLGPAHRRIFTRGALIGLLEYYGFITEASTMQGFLPLPLKAAQVAERVLARYSWNIVVRSRKPGN